MTARTLGWRKLIVLLLLLSPFYSVLSQDKKAKQKPSKTDQAQLTLKVPVDVVVVNATVTDKQGHPVVDLTVNDFKIYEDGKPQPIHTFALESYRATKPQDAASLRPTEAATSAGVPNYSQPRLISIVIDDVTSPASDYYRSMTKAAERFVERDLGPADQVAVLAGSGRFQYPFSSDRQLLLERIRTLSGSLNLGAAPRSTCPTLTDLQARRIAMNQSDVLGRQSLDVAREESLDCLGIRGQPGAEEIAEDHSRSAATVQFHETDRRNRTLLQTLRQHVRSLKHFVAAKNVILFSNGFAFQELVYELQDLVDQALRAGVILNTVDLRGLYTGVPQAGDIVHLPISMMREKQFFMVEDVSAKEGPLNQLAHDTGGTYYHNSNDLYPGLQEISNRQGYYYVLSYASPLAKSDGRYHRIKLEVSRPGLELSYRNGYYSPKEELTFERRSKEDILEAMRAPGDVNEIPINLSYNYYQLDGARYEVAFVTQVDIRRMQFPEEESRRRNSIILVLVAFDEADRYVDGLVRTVNFNLSASSYSELMSQGLASKVNFQLPPGRYRIKAVVRESTQSKMGSLTKPVEIP